MIRSTRQVFSTLDLHDPGTRKPIMQEQSIPVE
jgi:hypothetical protein